MKTTEQINKAIIAMSTHLAKGDTLIQTVGVDVLEHFEQYNDTGVVNRFYLAIPKGTRKLAVSAWLLAHGAISINGDKSSSATSPFVYDKNKVTSASAAAEDNWVSRKPEKTLTEIFDLQQAVRSLIKKAASAGSIKGGDRESLLKLAADVGIPESDVPTIVGKRNAAVDKAEEALI
jgi:hypothetical protein